MFEKQIFTYDVQQRLIKLQTFTAEGEEKSLQTVCQNLDGDWHYQAWKQGQLEREIISRPDSLVERSILHRSNAYCVEAYDFEREINTLTWYNDQLITYHEKYQWITQDGKPEKIAYYEYELANGRKKTFEREYALQEDGSLVGHETNWLRTDINWLVNYFERIEQFKGIQYPHEASFEAYNLLSVSPVIELHNYDGTLYRHYYTFTYE